MLGGQKILVVDDEPDNLDLFVRALRPCGTLQTATSGNEALDILRKDEYAVVITDHLMPGLTGVELLERAARLCPATERILVSGYGDVDTLTDAINRGHVSHFFPKPINPNELRKLVQGVLQNAPTSTDRVLVLASSKQSERVAAALRGAGLDVATSDDFGGTARPEDILVWTTHLTGTVMDQVRRTLRDARQTRRFKSNTGLAELVGASPAMRSVFATIEQVAPTDASVLLRGETGTGKEMVARVVHSLSARCDKPFVGVNCAALPESLVESELFGHEKGSFTGAYTRKLGRFERADGGTLFIDEVGNMPASVQVKLLRALQERAFERVGGSATLRVDIRLIAATNVELEKAMAAGQFREDLFYRLNVVPIELPPLRERVEDIPLLVDHFLPVFQRRLGKEGIRISDAMSQRLRDYHWPGNVRELMNVVERMVALTPSGEVAELQDLQVRRPRQRLVAMVPEAPEATLKEMVGEYEKRIIAQSLERHNGNRSRAARELGLTRQGLTIKIKKYGL